MTTSIHLGNIRQGGVLHPHACVYKSYTNGLFFSLSIGPLSLKPASSSTGRTS